MNESKIRIKVENEKPHIINRIVSGIIDACLIFMLFFGCYILFLNTEGKLMMAMLWTQQIMKQETLEEAKTMYERVPRLLKEKVT